MATPAREARTDVDPGSQLALFDVPERALTETIVPTVTPPRSNGGPVRLTLGEAARIIREAVKDKSYRSTPIGLEVAHFIRWFRNEYGARARRAYASSSTSAGETQRRGRARRSAPS